MRAIISCLQRSQLEAYRTQQTVGPVTGRFSLLAATRTGNATTYAYNDPSYRPTLTSYPDNGSTSTCYSDVGGASCSKAATNVVYTTVEASPSPSETNSVTSDGLGRPISSHPSFWGNRQHNLRSFGICGLYLESLPIYDGFDVWRNKLPA